MQRLLVCLLTLRVCRAQLYRLDEMLAPSMNRRLVIQPRTY